MEAQILEGGRSGEEQRGGSDELILDLVPDLTLQKEIFEIAILGKFWGTNRSPKLTLERFLLAFGLTGGIGG